FHPKLGERSSGNNSNLATNTRLNQACTVNHRVQRAGTEGFRVRTGSASTADFFGNGLREIATATIIPVADRFFRTTYDKVDGFRTELQSIEQRTKGMSCGDFGGEIFQQDVGSETRVFGMTRLESTHQSLTGIERERILLAERCNFRQCAHARVFTVGILCGVLLEPLLFHGNEIELIGTRELPIKPILINKIAETSLTGSSFDELVIPGLRKIAQLSGRNVADINLMRGVGRGRTKASEMILQLLFTR